METATLERLLRLDQYRRATRRRKAFFVYAVTGTLLVLFFLYALLIPDWGLPISDQPYTLLEYAVTQNALGYVYLIGVPLLGLSGLVLTYIGDLERASWFPAAMWGLLGAVSTLLGPGSFSDANSATALTSFIVVTGLFNGRRGALVAAVIATSFVIFDWTTGISGLATTAILLIVTGGLMYLYADYVELNRNEGITSAAEERVKLARINTTITQQASERANLQESLDAVLPFILESYPQVYHAQVFLLDDDGIQARLRASTGETGKDLIEQGHSLAVGSLSVIGQTTLKGEPVIARAGAENSVHKRNELLPETRVEAAFPLQIEGKIIGALDLQSRDDLRLTDDDISAFQSLADTLSLAIDNIRQFEVAQLRVEENQKLAEQARSALREVERLNKRLIGRAWSEYLNEQQSDLGLNIDFERDTTERDSQWTTTLANAAETNNIVRNDDVIAVPLTVRGQVIGAMEFELQPDGTFSPEDMELVREISERFGLAAENTRLVEESQRTAQRESLINEISSRFQTARDVEATLGEAARSLSETFMAQRVAIRLGVPQTASASTSSSGSSNGTDG